jgi:hypothetical protein
MTDSTHYYVTSILKNLLGWLYKYICESNRKSFF